MRFIAIDPGSRNIGYAVFEDDRLITYGAVNFEKVSYERRPARIIDCLDEVLRAHPVTEIAIEQAVKFQGKKIPELEVACVSIRKWAKARRLAYRSYNTATWKKGFAGDHRADKDAVARVAYLIWPSLPRELSDHTTDAIGIGSYHYGVRRLEMLAEGGSHG